MVRSDRAFSMVLLDADTKEPLRERVDSAGRTWVEGEEGRQFFVQVGGENPQTTIATIEVDGTSIGYEWRSSGPRTSEPLGSIKGNNFDEERVVRAFRFALHKKQQSGDEAQDSHPLNNTPVGTVTASWYTIQKEKNEASPAPWSVHNPKYTAWSTAGDDVRAATHHKKEASTLRAEVGSTPHTLACKTSNVSYLKKDHLQTLTIHYTTSFGLAVRHLLTDEETRAPPVSVKRAATEGGAVKEKEEGAAASSSCTKKAKKDDAAVYIEVE